MSRIKICAAEEQIRKNVSGAQAEFIRHCRIRNLSLRTIDYYQEDIEYFLKWSNLKFVDDITKDVMDNFVAHEMDKGNKVTAINSRIRGLRVFFRFCVDKEYMDGFKYPLEVSRLSRSTKQLCGIIDIIKEKHLRLIIVGSITIDCRKGEIDPMSKAFLEMSGVFAELELSMIRARVKSGMQNAREKGKRLGRRPTTKDDIPPIFYKHYPAFMAGTLNVSELARICGLSRPTVYKYKGLLK